MYLSPGTVASGIVSADPLLQPSPVPAIPFFEQLRSVVGRRALAIGLALLIETLLFLLLLSLGADRQPGKEKQGVTVVTLAAPQAAEEAREASSPERESVASERPLPQEPETEKPQPSEPAETPIAPVTPPVLPAPVALPPSSVILRNTAQPPPAPRQVYGPPDNGGSPALRDSERVGTAPNGEPLYAAAWYREPRPDQLRAYLSTARGPGWGLIACRTAPDYRVEDCVGLDEYPQGSQIMRAVLAAAWEFKVRPPRLGGRPLVGSWVQIRIDYGMERR
ncbi:MAG TPA: hypothetical protein VI381_07605 [Allosphingosinicella sp.]